MMSNDFFFNLSEDDLTFARKKSTEKNKLIFGILLKYFQLEGHYPTHIKYVDTQLLHCKFDFEGRSTERFRQEIRHLLGYRKATIQDVFPMKSWLIENIFPRYSNRPQQMELTYEYFRLNRIEPFTAKELERHFNSAYKEFEKRLFDTIESELSDGTKLRMDFLLSDEDILEDETHPVSHFKFKHLKQDVPGAKLKNVDDGIQK